tara:strand:+ start:9858 stop:10262 length:405 start_codon:yes stop_codon:yes gene_type:complete
MEKYRKIVEQHFSLDISKRTRQFRYIFARACYFYLCRKYTTYSLHDIGKSLGLNHATVMNAISKLDGMIHSRPINIQMYNSLIRKFNPNMDDVKPKITLNQLVRDYNFLLLENDQLKSKIEELTELIYNLADLD